MRKIIFDLDDTLYISKDLRNRREEAIINFIGEKKESYFEYKKDGKGTIESFKLLGLSREDFFKVIEEVELNLNEDKLLFEILKKLSEKYELCVLSNSSKKTVYSTLQKLGILGFFSECYYGEYFLNEKPDPGCFFMVKEGDICVGNSFKKDLEVPKKRGAITIAITSKSTPADYNIKDIYEILETIQMIEKNGAGTDK